MKEILFQLASDFALGLAIVIPVFFCLKWIIDQVY